jgi:hypothetical protein
MQSVEEPALREQVFSRKEVLSRDTKNTSEFSTFPLLKGFPNGTFCKILFTSF